MKINKRWSFSLLFVVIIFFTSLAVLVIGQGPALTSLATPTPLPLFSQEQPNIPIERGSAGQTALPDLIVESIETNPATPLVNRPAIISVTIKNQKWLCLW